MTAPCWGPTVTGRPCKGIAHGYAEGLCHTHNAKLTVSRYRIKDDVATDEDVEFVREQLAREIHPVVVR